MSAKDIELAAEIKKAATLALEGFEKIIEEFGDLCSVLDENIMSKCKRSTDGVVKVEDMAIQQESGCRLYQLKMFSSFENSCNVALQINKISIQNKARLESKSDGGANTLALRVFTVSKTLQEFAVQTIPSIRKVRTRFPKDFSFTFLESQTTPVFIPMVYFGFRMITRNALDLKVIRKTVGKSGSGEAEFNTSYGITTHPETGNVYVADFCNHRIQVFDREMNFLFQFGSRGKDAQDYEYPSGLAFMSNGETLVIVDNDNRRIKFTNPEGKVLKIIDGSSPGTHNFDEPYFVALDADDNIYVSDRDNYRIQKYDKEGNFVMFIGERESSEPVGRVCAILVTDNNEVIGLEEGGNTLKIYTTQGTFTKSVTIPQTQSRKNFLARASHGGYMLSDRGNNCILFFDSNHSFYHRIDINTPIGVAFGDNDTLYVVGCDSSIVSLY